MEKNTRTKILETAARSFGQNGYAGTSLREIAEELNITKAALYYHFESKEDIFNSCLNDTMAHFRTMFLNVRNSKEPFWDIIYSIVYGMISFSIERPYTFKLLRLIGSQNFDYKIPEDVFQFHFQAQFQQFIKMVEQAVKEDEIRSDIPPSIIAASMISVIMSSVGPVIREKFGFDFGPKEHSDYIIKLLKGGLEIK